MIEIRLSYGKIKKVIFVFFPLSLWLRPMFTNYLYVRLLYNIRSGGRRCLRRHKRTKIRETMNMGALLGVVPRES